MKKISYSKFPGIVITILLVSIFTTSCKDDAETPDPCDGITCLNGGECINGECDCPEGFTGPNCGSQKTPTSIRVSNIRVTKFPPTESNGGGWDLTDGPDIYVTLSYNNSVIYDHPTFVEDANPSQVYDFTPNINLNITNPTDRYVIRLWDYDDFSEDDYMGGIEFTPYTSSNNFPAKIMLDAGAGLAFELSLQYTF